MNLTTVTMTGADDQTQPHLLCALSIKYPFVEWGILLSRTKGRPRFPKVQWMEELENAMFLEVNMNLSGHLCGAYVRELLMGDTDFVEEIGNLWHYFQRIQINTHGIEHPYDKDALIDALSRFPEKEFIFQYDNANTRILDEVVASGRVNVSTLFDLSHGAGVLPGKWPSPIEGVKCGYAGGLSPINVREQLDLIEARVGNRDIWIDMETRVRNCDDRFDLNMVESVFISCEKYAANYSPEIK